MLRIRIMLECDECGTSYLVGEYKPEVINYKPKLSFEKEVKRNGGIMTHDGKIFCGLACAKRAGELYV